MIKGVETVGVETVKATVSSGIPARRLSDNC